MVYEYDEEVLKSFIENQGQLFSENIADTPEAAEEFLEECMATDCSNAAEVKEYFEEAGIDIMGMSDDEILEQSEVFAIPDGRYLIVEG